MIQSLRHQIAQVEARMAADWRNYAAYDQHLVRLKLRLELKLGEAVLLAKAKAAKLRAACWRTLQRAAARLEWFMHMAWIKKHRPATYDWGVDETAVIDKGD